jgi:uncharacterized protein (DUF983 family)
METKKAPLSIRVIYWVTNVSFWMAMALFFILMVSNFLIFTGIIKGNDLYNRNIHVNVSNIRHLHLNNLKLNLKLVDTANYLDFVNLHNFFAKKAAPFLLLYFLIFTYLIWIFRKFIINVKRGKNFTVKNISLLKRISYVLAGYWLFVSASVQLANYYFTGHLEIYKSFLLNEHLLWDALFIWVIAHVFITGLKLQQEKDLTI